MGSTKAVFVGLALASLLGCGEDAPGTSGGGAGQGGGAGAAGNAGTPPQGPLALPGTPAPPLAPTPLRPGPSNFYDNVKFLFEGGAAPQAGIAKGTFPVEQVSVVRGRVLDEAGKPLPGVRVSAVNTPEWGSVMTRADGSYDFAIVGGSQTPIRFALAGALPSQRRARALWNRFETLPDVVLLAPAATSTPVTFGSAAWQVATGDRIVDKSGSRRVWIGFPPATKANAVDGKGVSTPLPTAVLRITEFTRGDRGQEAMPGELPPRSAYTFAVSLAFDEAPASSVTFDKDVYVYVEDFLKFPVGTTVPAGTFVGDEDVWKGDPSGRVLAVVGSAASAGLDADGDGKADDGAKLGLAEGELAAMAPVLPAGGRVWRVPLRHFSPKDFNWPVSPPADATAPPADDDDDAGGAAGDHVSNQKSTLCGGSTVSCEDRVLGEDIPVVGTGMWLHYQSDRVGGRKAPYSLAVPVTGQKVAKGARAPTVTIQIAGQLHTSPGDLPAFEAKPGQTLTWAWDGRDQYGRVVPMTSVATVKVTQPYDVVYAETGDFDGPPGAPLPGAVGRPTYDLTTVTEVPLGVFRAETLGLGGWTLSVHHAYDVDRRALHLGSGGQIAANNIGGGVARVFGRSATDYDQAGSGEGLFGTNASLKDVAGLAQTPDGRIYFTEAHGAFAGDPEDGRLRRIDPDGSVHTVAGSLSGGSDADGVAPSAARLAQPIGVAIFRGNVCYADKSRVRCIEGGLVKTVYTSAGLSNLSALAVGIDKALYVTGGINGITRIASDGTTSLFAGGGKSTEDGAAALDAQIDPYGLAAMPDGTLAFSEPFANRVRGVTPDGRVRLLAGTGAPGSSGDDGPATSAQLSDPRFLAPLPNGSLVIGEWGGDGTAARLRIIDVQRKIVTLAGGKLGGASEGAARAVSAFLPTGILPQGDGTILYGDGDSIVRLTLPYPGASEKEISLASPDGSELFVFDGGGRHLRTLDALTKAMVLTFGYDADGYLVSVTDAFGRAATIERDGNHNAKTFLAPFGQKTALTVDGKGMLAQIVDPIGRTDAFTYGVGGLLTARKDARGGDHTMTYDPEGMLVTDKGPGGKTWTLADGSANGTVERKVTSALGRELRTSVLRTGPSAEIRTITRPDGTKTTTTQTATSVGSLAADGTKVEATLAPDPQWGMSAPYPSTTTVTYPSGATVKRVETREADRTDASDPAAILSVSSTLAVGSGKPWRSEYETATRTVTLTSAAGRVARKQMDDHGRILRVETPGVLPVVRKYDADGRTVAIAQGARTIGYAYSNFGYASSVTDALGRVTAFQRDAVGRPISVTLPGSGLGDLPRVLGLAFDENDNAVSASPPGRAVHAFGYTPDDRVERTTAPGNPPAKYVYDADRAPTLATLEDGTTLALAYDAAGRWAKTSLAGDSIVPAYDPKTGQLVSLTGPGTESLVIARDGSRVVSAASTGSVTGTTFWDYDLRGRVFRDRVDASNLAVSYDDDDLVTEVGPVKLTREDASGSVTTIQTAGTYEEIERTLSEGGAIVSYGEPTHWRVSVAGSAVYDLALERDIGGRVIKRVETVEGTKRTYEYAYDDAGRLASFEVDGVKIASYAYDRNNNRLSEEGEVTVGIYDDQDRVTAYGSASYVHDARGNRTSQTVEGITTTYEHDAPGALRAVQIGPLKIAYAVDALGRRIARSENGVTTHRWLYRNMLQPAAEYDGVGKLRWRFVYATGRHAPDAAIDGDGVVYKLVTDQVGSLRLLVRGSDGVVVQRMRHDAWGRVETDFVTPGFAPLPFGFAGGIADRATGLVHFGAREYDPALGRWVERDPIGLWGGLNPYSYAGSVPHDAVDLTGLTIQRPPGPGFGAFFESAAQVYYEISAHWVKEAQKDYAAGDYGSAALDGSVAGSLAFFGATAQVAPTTLELLGSFAVGAVVRCPGTAPVRNAHLAGKSHPKTGIPFDKAGYPDFSEVAHPDIPSVRITLSGSRSTDFARANDAAGLSETPEGYTWHHHQDPGLMQLVEAGPHKYTGHTGGFSGPR